MTWRATIEEARRLGLTVPEPKRRNKYNAEPITWNGYRFDSKREAELLIPIMRDALSGWVFHPRWKIKTGAGSYETIELDLYWPACRVGSGYIDVKGHDGKESQRRRAAFEHQYGVKVEIWK